MKSRTLKNLDRLFRFVLAKLPRRFLEDAPGEPSSILVIKLSAMGDALCMMPAVRMISLAFPAATIDWLTTARTNPEIFRNLNFLGKMILLPTTKYSLFLFVVRKLWKFRHYDLVIDFDQYYQVSELFARCGKISAGFDAPLKGRTFSIKLVYRPDLNEKYQFRDLARQVISHWQTNCPEYDPYLPEIVSTYEPMEEVKQASRALKYRNRPILVIYPGSSCNAMFRRWDWKNYQQIILTFQDSWEVVIAGGPDEQNISITVEKKGLKAHNWIKRWTLLDWAWFFHNEKPCLIGNDGGLLHVAEAVRLPVIGIFGPSRFSKWGSVNPESIAFEADVDCRPCLRNYLGDVPQRCWKGTSECLTRIPSNVVIDAIEQSINRTRRATEVGNAS